MSETLTVSAACSESNATVAGSAGNRELDSYDAPLIGCGTLSAMAASGVPSVLKSPMAVDQPRNPAAVPSLNAGRAGSDGRTDATGRGPVATSGRPGQAEPDVSQTPTPARWRRVAGGGGSTDGASVRRRYKNNQSTPRAEPNCAPGP